MKYLFDYSLIMQCSLALYEVVERNVKDKTLQLDEEPVRSVGDSCDEDLLASRHGEVRGGGE